MSKPEEQEQFIRRVLKTLGFTDEEADSVMRQRVFRDEKVTDYNAGAIKMELAKMDERLDAECLRDDILINQLLVKLMRCEGWSEEKIEERMGEVI